MQRTSLEQANEVAKLLVSEHLRIGQTLINLYGNPSQLFYTENETLIADLKKFVEANYGIK